MGWYSQPSTASVTQLDHCGCCNRDLSTLRADARFCPACGSQIPLPPRRHFALMRCLIPLVHLGRGNVPDSPAKPGRTAILTGYANALYHLGWRYERGCGTPRNLSEANRCYRKSARLGNLDAVVRLAPNADADATPVMPLSQNL